MENLKPSALASAAGISMSYASEIMSGKRKPSRALAIHILRCTGWRHTLLAGLTDLQVDALEVIEPWAGGSSIRHAMLDSATRHDASTGNQGDLSGQEAA